MVFLKKEIREYYRTGRLFVFGIAALLLGLMNPAVAKLTPRLLETMADSLKESGMSVAVKEADAFACWQQYYKNLPMLLIIIMIILAGSFAKEYSHNTLLLVVTKGYSRRNIYLAKALMMFAVYTLASLVYFGITYFYSGFYWDNSIVSNIFAAAAVYWLFGILIIAMILFFSSFINEATGIMAATGIFVMFYYLLAIIPKLKKYLPVKLTESQALLTKSAEIGDFTAAIIATLVVSAGLFAAGYVMFGKKKL